MNDLIKYAKLIENSTADSNIDRSLTFKAWHERACVVHDVVLSLKDERDKKIAEASENYKNAALDAAIDAANADFDSLAQIARDKIESDLESVLDSKRRAWDRANAAPDDGMVRMLQVLEMRGTDLTADEVVSVVSKLNNNAPALRALKSICGRAGIALPEFVGSSPSEFEERMSEAEQYARKNLETLTVSLNDLEYMPRLFWSRPGGGLDHSFFDGLDRTVLTTAMIERTVEPDEANTEPEADNKADKEVVEE